ncbi:iron-containing redox enzyme family protein [Alicyclobacillus sendaiensis]|uniref:iron-containing redox enzyme family protein n=1 Tax=Alicyclobacillus sendaiensis TaxID=192387 RepID=UPI0026F466AD|nr:iron-containing redox enzyme family protein [Alicyclobacillus sendaiensis]
MDKNRMLHTEFSIEIPARSEEAGTLDERVAYLLGHYYRDPVGCSRILQEIDATINSILRKALDEEKSDALLEIHKTLYTIYEVSFAHPMSAVTDHEYSTWLLGIRNRLEDTWLTHELSTITELLDISSIATPEGICEYLTELSKEKSTVDKSVEDFLANSATIDQFKLFVLSDGYLNYRFFDALSLTQKHFCESVKFEISHHLWDECGNGVMENAHTWKFSKALDAMGLYLPEEPIWEDWRPYAGYNLYFLLGFRRRHFFKALGSLAMPELFDPDRDRAVVKGLERLFPDARSKFEYFYDHIEVDEGHGSSWLANVIAPIVSAQPESAIEFAIGGILRMRAMRRYNEYLAERFGLSTLVGECG